MNIVCKECKGKGEVVFTKERGGPRCNNCGGAGNLTPEITQQVIAAILDSPSVYMGGPSNQSLRKARTVIEWMQSQGFFDANASSTSKGTGP